MQRKKLKTFGLTLIAFALSLFTAQAQLTDVLSVYPDNGSIPANYALGNIQRVTFLTDDFSVLLLNGNNFAYAYENTDKIVFANADIFTDISNPLVPGLNIVTYITPAGELVVDSFADIKSLTLLSIDGKILQKGISSSMFVGYLPASIYLLQIETAQGIVVKKVFKQ